MRIWEACGHRPAFLRRNWEISRTLMGNRFKLFGYWIAALINVLNDVIFPLSQIGHLKSWAVLRLSGNSLRHKHAENETLKQGVASRWKAWNCGSVVIARWEMVGSHSGSAAAARLQTGYRVMTHMPMLFHLHRPQEHGNTHPEKAEGTRMGGRRNVYPTYFEQS